MSQLAQTVQKAVDAIEAGKDVNAATGEGTDMAKTKKAKAVRKPKAEKMPRVKKEAKTKNGGGKRGQRIAADAVFTFVKQVDGLPKRAQAILNAVEKIDSGTAEQVAARVTKTDYDGKQELVYLSGFFLRKFVKLGAVKVVEA